MIRGLSIVSIRSQFREVFQQADAKVMAFFGMELHAIDIFCLNGTAELQAVR
ncbi:hypothetical protein D3C79_1024130 [compost metagenome]